LTISEPVRDLESKQIIGTVRLLPRSTTLWARDLFAPSFGRTGYGVVIDRRTGRVLLHPNPVMITKPARELLGATWSRDSDRVSHGSGTLAYTEHDSARIADQRATWGITEGNPIHDDVRAIAAMVPPHFSIDVALNRDQQITAVFAGNLFAEHKAACAHVKATAMRAVPEPFDVVVTTNSGYPLDQNLYQAVKGMSAAAQIVKTGGVIVCAAECRDGLPSHGSYGEVLASQPNPGALLDMIRTPGRPTRPDQWQVQVQAQVQLKAAVHVKTSGLTHDQVRAAHFTPIDDVAGTVRQVLARAGAGATLCVLPQGPQTIPYVDPRA